jgi:hypothetical protein
LTKKKRQNQNSFAKPNSIQWLHTKAKVLRDANTKFFSFGTKHTFSTTENEAESFSLFLWEQSCSLLSNHVNNERKKNTRKRKKYDTFPFVLKFLRAKLGHPYTPITVAF